jgi:hypothetical protein
MRSWIIPVASLVLIGLAFLATYALLPACGLHLPFGLGAVRFCPAPAPAALRADDSLQERAMLTRQIAEAEGRLAALQCTPVALPQTEVPEPEAPLDSTIIERGDVALLEGCWALVSDYRTVDPESGSSVDFSDWQICFDAAGIGRETMRGSDGTICEGQVKVGFEGETTLVIDEPDDLPCSNGYSIYRRQVRCTVDAMNVAQCQSLQPEVAGAVDLTMRRAKEQP